jgi:hypothetical protein
MSDKNSRSASEPVISLQGIAAPFLSSLQGCRDYFFSSFAGLSKASEGDLDEVQQGQPILFARPDGIEQSEILKRAKTHLFLSALSELRRINNTFYSELRRFLEFNRIGRLDISAEDKQASFAKVLENKSDNNLFLAEQIEALLPNGFGFSKELRSLDRLEKFFYEVLTSGGDLNTLPPDIEVDLLRAELQGEDDILKPTLSVLPSNRKVAPIVAEAKDVSLIQEIFFTPYAIGLNLLQATEKHLSKKP